MAYLLGGRSAQGLLVTITTRQSTKTMDKTAKEIINALNTGVTPVFKDEDTYTTYQGMLVLSVHDDGHGSIRLNYNAAATPFVFNTLDDYPSVTSGN